MSETIPINEASAAQLREFAATHLGIELPATANCTMAIAKIREATYDKDEIPVPESAGPEAAQTGPAPRPVTPGQLGPKPGYVRVIIQIQEGTGGNDPVPLGCNGPVMLAPRGEEIDIPYRYFESLKNAVQAKYDSLPDGGINPVPRQVSLYPYQPIAFGAREEEAAA